MKEKKLKIITILMLMTVVGLISIQLIWINHAYSIEEIRFEEKVRKALRNVNKKIEKKQAAKFVFNRIEKGQNAFVYLADSSRKYIKKFNWQNKNKNKVSLEIESKITDSTNGHLKITKRIYHDSNNEHLPNSNRTEIDSLIFGKQKLVTEVVDEIITLSSSELKIYSKKLLDSLIKIELGSLQIEPDYEFGLMSPDKKFIEISDKRKEADLRKSRMRITLFPEKLLRPPNILVIDFPNKSIRIVRSISWMLILSLTLISIIIYLFYKTVMMFLLQRKSNEIKNDLINNITHEFKTPLATISLAIDMCFENKIQDEINSKYLNMIRDENAKLSKLIENLLNIATLEKGSFVIKKSLLSINSLLTKLVIQYNIIAKRRNGKVIYQALHDEAFVYADNFHLSAAIANIIDNALKYSKEEPYVRIISKIYEEKLIIDISDRGIGIPKSELENIFETFYRTPSGNIHNVKGYGIGLSYTKKIIEFHNGTIVAKSKLNEGSSFIIELLYEK